MPNKLKKLTVTSVDLVDQGANPDSHVRLFKRRESAVVLQELEKRYGGAAEGVPQDDVLHPEVQKALEDFQKLTKRQTEEIEALKKSLELQRLTAAARKYEVLGKRADELALKLYELKKAGGTIYDDYVALLDENVTALSQSGLFCELGKNTQGRAGTAETIGIRAAELAKSAGGKMPAPDAIVRAFEENPELAAQYETEYRGGM